MIQGAFPDKDFGPRIDTERSNPFFPAHPIEILEKGEYNHVPLIAGVTENEGLVYLGSKLIELRDKQMKMMTIFQPLVSFRLLIKHGSSMNGPFISSNNC